VENLSVDLVEQEELLAQVAEQLVEGLKQEHQVMVIVVVEVLLTEVPEQDLLLVVVQEQVVLVMVLEVAVVMELLHQLPPAVMPEEPINQVMVVLETAVAAAVAVHMETPT
jgi:hypothetical protein